MMYLQKWKTKRQILVAVLLAVCVVVGIWTGVRTLAAENSSVTVTFDLNGGQLKEKYKGYDWVTDQLNPVSTEPGEYVELPSNYYLQDYYEKQGERELFFAGWAYDAAGKKKIKPERLTFDKDTTVYARWQPQVVVTFDANGGYFGDSDNTYPQEKVNVYSKSGYSLVAPTDPRQSGKAFVDWYLTSECNEDDLVSAVEFYDFEKDTTLYAGWTDGYAVTYDFNGGRSEQGRKKEVKSYPTGTAIDYPTKYSAPSDSRKGIAGWYTDPGFSEESKFENGTVLNADATLYAKWVEKFTVTIKGAPVRGNDSTFDHGEKTVQALPGDAIDYSSWGYGSNKNKVLAGFYTEQNGKGDRATTTVWAYEADPVQFDYRITYTPIADTTLYAYWTNPITVTFDANGGQFERWDGDKRNSEFYDSLEEIRAPGVKWNADYYYVGTPYRSGYIFKGWSEDKNATTGIGYSELVSDKSGTVYAAWEKREYQELSSTSSSTSTTKKQEEPSSQKQDEPTSKNSEEPSSQKPVEPSSQKADEPTSKQSEEPSSKQSEEPTTKKSEEPTTKKSEEPSTKKTEEPSTKQSEEPTTQKNTPKPVTTLNGLVQGPDGKWAIYKNGAVDKSATGVFQNVHGWWRVEKGYVNFNAQGIYQNTYGWWKTTNGKVTFKETGVFQNEFGWWRVKDSKVDFNANGIYQNKYGWWKTKNGKVDFSFTGIAKNEYGTWYVKTGKVDFSKNGKVSYNGKSYTVENGKVK